MNRNYIPVLVLVLTGLARQSYAHEFNPAYFQLTQVDDQIFDAFWRVPVRAVDSRTTLRPIIISPECNSTDCIEFESNIPQPRIEEGSYLSEWQLKDPHSLIGTTIQIAGLHGSGLDVIVRIVRLDGTTTIERLTQERHRFSVTAAPPWTATAWTYFVIGVEHIIFGIDHLLFVLALLMLVRGWKRLIATITAFTVAHSVTLLAATLGWLQVPGPPVEAIIALSIVFVAAEIVRQRQGNLGVASQSPWLIAALFGLLHGLGFAGALSEVGLPDHAIPLALFFFNVGVEAGQIVFVATMMLLIAIAGTLASNRGDRSGYEIMLTKLNRPTAYLVGSLATFWTIQRIAIIVSI